MERSLDCSSFSRVCECLCFCVNAQECYGCTGDREQLKIRFIYIVAPNTVTLKPYKNIYELRTHIFVSHCSCIVLLL